MFGGGSTGHWVTPKDTIGGLCGNSVPVLCVVAEIGTRLMPVL